MYEKDVKKIEEVFKHHIGILSGVFITSWASLPGGHQMLSEKLDRVESQPGERMDRVEQRISEVDTRLSKKIDAVAADLGSHRADFVLFGC
ncbi:MAG: hypothetical protein HXY45_17290 [Syntrophaceae bacterium]|nr:hypothetical protein [Syntrophaceae bacterium]